MSQNIIKLIVGSKPNYIYRLIRYQFTNCQDQNFTSPDIKKSVLLKSSLGTD